MEQENDAWYTDKGDEADVVLSTKVRIARNLANFPFPVKMKGRDAERVQSLVFDAFNHLENGEKFQAIQADKLDLLSSHILEERGILSPSEVSSATRDTGVILRTDGRVSCTVNVVDHVRISSFVAGMAFEQAVKLAKDVDLGLQKTVQFAASYDFGYLTSSLTDAGSGEKISLKVHLPSISALGRIGSLIMEMNERGIGFAAAYGSGSTGFVSGIGKGSSLGAYYEIRSLDSQSGTEFDQMTSIAAAAKKIVEYERVARAECSSSMPSDIRNFLFRALALARSSVFVPLREAVEIISAVKWALDMNLLTGIDDSVLFALLYRIQEAHLEYVLKNGSFNFEKDISGTVKKNARLRALILQEAFEDIKLMV